MLEYDSMMTWTSTGVRPSPLMQAARMTSHHRVHPVPETKSEPAQPSAAVSRTRLNAQGKSVALLAFLFEAPSDLSEKKAAAHVQQRIDARRSRAEFFKARSVDKHEFVSKSCITTAPPMPIAIGRQQLKRRRSVSDQMEPPSVNRFKRKIVMEASSHPCCRRTPDLRNQAHFDQVKHV